MSFLRLSFALSMLLLLGACGKNNPEAQTWVRFIPTLEQLEGLYASADVPPQALEFNANLQFVNFSEADEFKVARAVELIKQVVASPEFKAEILGFSYNGQTAFVDNNGMSNGEIYLVLLEGAEQLSPARNHAIDAQLELYYANNNTIGYTYPHTPRISMNTKYFNQYTAAQVAQNLFHEWLHKLGFRHATSWSPARDASVPYAIGRMIGRHARALL